ncbi:hypothetical protein FIV42_21010 [Persicimonas caeni]|uniref:GAF domain-containing protein n=1 Tax=Persicimonas caeni TaxID=2292766 RepID=A0A4Y6PXT8_PERCE|nr:hypothetical protein [Persicimonas caeni]QDG53131.1 hypothetical protein FIV42_21010 [Persicimonas caeni]QED34353.1 hypothetical protein FRD00_21005 [Persicimonas caeni]
MAELVEAAYRIEVDRQAWLDGLAEVLGQIHGKGPGLMVYLFDASQREEGVHLPAYALYGLDETFAEATIKHNAASPPDDTRLVYGPGVRCSTVSELLADQGIVPAEHPSFGPNTRLIGIEDAWGLTASDAHSRGVAVAAPLNDVSQMSGEMRELWQLIGTHLLTAYRLRRRHVGGQDIDEAARDLIGASVDTAKELVKQEVLIRLRAHFSR